MFRIMNKKYNLSVAGCSALLVALLSGNAPALEINFTDVGAAPMSAPQLAAFNQAATLWENTLSDPITVNINIAWAGPATFALPTILGSTSTAFTSKPYASVLIAMAIDSDSADEINAISQLPGILPIVDINGMRNVNHVTMSTANAKALGMSPNLDPVWGAALPNNADAEIKFNTNYLLQFDLDPSDGIGVTQTDFVGTAAHEIGHALGFWSMMDNADIPANSGLQLSPNVLDIWRFTETGMSHVLNSETRQMTAGPADYDDSQLLQFMSRGKAAADPNCNTSSGTCQGSHWRDDAGNMMDPTIAQGIRVFLKSDDTHVLDYVGYELNPLRISLLRFLQDMRLVVFDISDLGNPPEPLPGIFPTPPPPPDGGSEANMAMMVHVDFGTSNTGEDILGGARTLLGVAEFREAELPAVQNFAAPAPVALDDWEHTQPPRDPMQLLAPMICNPVFASDEKGGVPFMAMPLPGDECLPFDAAAGDNGGWRLPLCIDSLTDNTQQNFDCDSRWTLMLLLEDPVNEVKLDNLLNMGLKIDPATPDNTLMVQDASAMGLSDVDQDNFPDAADNCTDTPNSQQRDTDGDGYGNICDPDLNNDGLVTVTDFLILRGVLNTPDPDCDFNGDGLCTVTDFLILRSFLNKPPGPSGVAP